MVRLLGLLLPDTVRLDHTLTHAPGVSEAAIACSFEANPGNASNTNAHTHTLIHTHMHIQWRREVRRREKREDKRERGKRNISEIRDKRKREEEAER